MSFAIGIDVGGTRVKAVAVNADGGGQSEIMFRTDATDRDIWSEQLRAAVADIEQQRGEPARWLGVSAPGLAAPDGSGISWMQGRLETVQGMNWRDALGREHAVPVLNDGHAALLAEVWRGAADDCENVVMLTLGTGVGGAIMCDGRLLRGGIGRAGHLGHISLDAHGDPDIVKTPGSLEYMIGNYSIAERSGGRFEATYEMLSAYREGDSVARYVWLKSVKALAVGIVSIINAVDPEVVVLAGGITEAGEALFDPLRQFMDQFEWRPHGHRVQLRKAMAGEYAGALGAAYNAIREAEGADAGRK